MKKYKIYKGEEEHFMFSELSCSELEALFGLNVIVEDCNEKLIPPVTITTEDVWTQIKKELPQFNEFPMKYYEIVEERMWAAEIIQHVEFDLDLIIMDIKEKENGKTKES